MTSKSLYKITSLTGAITFSQGTDFWISTIKGLGAQTVIFTTQSANQIGTSINSISMPPRKITVNGTIDADVEFNRRKLQNVLAPGAQVKFEITDNKETWYIEGIVEKSPDFGDGDILQGFQFSLYCAYPYFKKENVSFQLAGLIPLFSTPFFTGGTWQISAFSPDLFKHIPNIGNLPMAFTLIFYARAKIIRPAIFNADKNSFIKTSITLLAGEQLKISTIDADKDIGGSVIHTSASGIKTNGYRYIIQGSDLSMTIAPSGNVIVAAADENITNLNCTLICAGGECHSI